MTEETKTFLKVLAEAYADKVTELTTDRRRRADRDEMIATRDDALRAIAELEAL